MSSTHARPIPDGPRIARERKTVGHMVALYCRDKHATRDTLCEQCGGLYAYAMARLDRCVYGNDKPTCKQCPVHCYRKDLREEMREVMRYAGPRMLLSHPVLAIRHLLDERQPPPPHPTRSTDHNHVDTDSV